MNQVKSKLIPFFLGILMIGVLTVSKKISAQPDTVYISSGEILYGEIKSFDRNVLTFDTNYADSDFKIDWDEVTGLASSTELTVYTTDGTRVTGKFRYAGNTQRFNKIVTENTELSFSLDDIIWFVSHEKDFWQRIVISSRRGIFLCQIK